MKKLSFIFILSVLLVGCYKEDIVVENKPILNKELKNEVVAIKENVIQEINENEPTVSIVGLNDSASSKQLEFNMSAQDLLNDIRELLPKNSVIQAMNYDGYNQFIVTCSDLDLNYLVNILVLNNEEDLMLVDKDLYIKKDTYTTTIEVVKGNVCLFMEVPNSMFNSFYETLYNGYFKDFTSFVNVYDWNNLDIPLTVEL